MATLPSSPTRDRCIGRWALTALIMNSVIGAGIFGLPATVAQAAGSFALWAYVFGAAAAAIIVTVVAELGSRFHEPGGAYLYVSRAFGPGLGTQTGWFSFLARTTTAAAIAGLLLDSLANFWPVLAGQAARDAGLLLILGTLAAINLRGAHEGILTSNGLLVLKLLPLVMLIAAGLFHWSRGAAPLPTAAPGWNGWSDALLAMVFAFSGFESAMIPGGNIREPRRDIPPAAFGALALIFALYFCLHLVTMRVVPAMAVSTHPLSDAAAVYLGGAGRTVMSAAAVLSTLGWLASAAFSAPRLTESMARDGVLPRVLARKRTADAPPRLSIFLWAVLVFALASYGTFFWNVVLSVAARMVVYSTMCAAVPKLRSSAPPQDAWRAPGGWAVPAAGILLCALLATRLKSDHIFLLLVVGAAAASTRRPWRRRVSN